jgi:hypothetical protein
MNNKKCSNCEYFKDTSPSFCSHKDHPGFLVPKFTVCEDWEMSSISQLKQPIIELLTPLSGTILTDTKIEVIADYLIVNAGYRKQSEGWWEWFEEWSPSTTEHPRECDDCGWRCGKCKTALSDVMGGYWDDFLEKPNLSFCPSCGAKMKGGAE